MKRGVVAAAALLAGLTTGCGGRPAEDGERQAAAPVAAGPEAVADAPPVGYASDAAAEGHRALRFADGQVSLNDRCPVRKRGLNLRLLPVYVNGAPIGFC